MHLEQLWPPDFVKLRRLGEEQSVLGLVAAGLEHISDEPVAKEDVIPFLQRVLVLENRNSAMNVFVASLFGRLHAAGISALLVKGQGIAQCYSRPQWRAPGDIDLLLPSRDYEMAKALLVVLAASEDDEDLNRKHLAMTIDDWVVELHGTLRARVSNRVNRTLDQIQDKEILVFLSDLFDNWQSICLELTSKFKIA